MALSLRALLGSALCGGLGWLSRRRLAQTEGTLRLRGLRAPVEVIRDRWGVPHIYARHLHDLWFAQGFVHAQDRLWQMDFQRRLAAGRLSEVLGPATLPVDRWLRILGLRRLAEREAALLQGELRASLEAYAAGVNACIEQGRLPVECAVLAYRPEPWTPADTLAWVKMVAWSLSANWESELLRAQLVARLGPERAAELEPGDGGRCPCVVPPGVDYARIGRAAQERVARARPVAGPPASAGLGSNAWVLAGWRTASGAPLVANDLHQPMSAPALWYENHLEAGDLRVTGCTLPGAFGVICGHNGRVAWGFSNAMADVQDLYVERLQRLGDGRVRYAYRGEWLEARVRREEIAVRGRRSAVQEVILTRHGPIVNVLAPDLAGEQPLALRWTSQDPDTTPQACLEMMRADDCAAFHRALRRWTGAPQSAVYADRRGSIGYTLCGRLPLRPHGDGRVPVPGWTGEHEWVGYVAWEELPHLADPATGYVACANNRLVDDRYPHYIGCDYCAGDRAARIRELIEERAEIDLAYARQMQLDLVSPGARALAAHLGRLAVSDPDLEPLVALMREWDGTLAADSPAAAVHGALVPRLGRLVLSGKLGDLTAPYMGQGPNAALADGSLFGFRAWEWLQALLEDPASPWFDLGGGETRDDVLRLALRQTADHLRAELGPQVSDWSWGRLHTLTYGHTLGRLPGLGELGNRGPWPVGGDYTTVCAAGASQHPDENGGRIIGPSYRFLADLADLDRSLSQLVPGQSGQPESPHYDDQVAGWFTGEYHPMLFARQDVERQAEARLLLVPDS